MRFGHSASEVCGGPHGVGSLGGEEGPVVAMHCGDQTTVLISILSTLPKFKGFQLKEHQDKQVSIPIRRRN